MVFRDRARRTREDIDVPHLCLSAWNRGQSRPSRRSPMMSWRGIRNAAAKRWAWSSTMRGASAWVPRCITRWASSWALLNRSRSFLLPSVPRIKTGWSKNAALNAYTVDWTASCRAVTTPCCSKVRMTSGIGPGGDGPLSRCQGGPASAGAAQHTTHTPREEASQRRQRGCGREARTPRGTGMITPTD